MKTRSRKARQGFWEPDLLIVIISFVVLVSMGWVLIEKRPGYWWLIVLTGVAIWSVVLYGLGIIGFSRRNHPKPRDKDKDDQDS